MDSIPFPDLVSIVFHRRGASDYRLPLAIALILAISMAPALLRKKPAPTTKAPATQTAAVPAASPLPPAAAPVTPLMPADSQAAVPVRLIPVRSALYRHAVSTEGGRLVSTRLLRYHPGGGRSQDTLELIPARQSLLDARLIAGGDTIPLNRVHFTATTDSVLVTTTPVVLTLTGDYAGRTITLNYTFSSDDYRIGVAGNVSGMPATGGTLLVGLGNGFADTEIDTVANHRELGIVTKLDKTRLIRFNSIKAGQQVVNSGPFEWVAVKSKYFVAGLFAYDSTSANGGQGRVGGVRAVPDSLPRPVRAHVEASVPVSANGGFAWSMYLGPMEYDRLTRMGHDFDDVNPYGWPGFRTIVRPFAVAIRTVFIGMHHALGLGYGLVIVLFGILVRILTWPLNSKAMRSMTAMSAIQPQLTALQERYKEDPQRLQQEMMKLYKDNKVNPFGGCWPMLIPYPLLVAVFFVLANTIELRGVPFLWMHDLSRHDPLYIIPLLMAGSMFVLSRISQMGVPPNPQAKTMAYMMPVVMGVMFARFAAGLNLYYAVQNLAALPQQWMIMKERQRLNAAKNAAQVVRTKR